MIDGDTVFEPKTISTLVQPFARPWVGAVSGNAKVANRKKIVGRWQHIEYVIGFNIDRRIQDLLGCMTTIPGAVGAFRRKALLQVGGVSEDTLAEDTDLTMAVCSAGWEIVYEERARAWTEAPTTLQQLWRQRYRWSYGTMQAMWKHRGAIFKSGPAGRMGRVGLLNLAIFQVLLPALAPLIDVFLIYGLLALDPIATIKLWLAVLAIQMFAGLIAFAMERENPLPAAVDAAAAAGLPPADVRRFDQVAGHCPRRGPAEVAEAQASRRLRRRRRPWRCAVKRLFGVFDRVDHGGGLTACSTTVSGAPAAATGSPAAARPAFGAYLDISVKQPDLAAVAKQAGLKHVNLAFALANNGACDPAWGGNQPIDALKAADRRVQGRGRVGLGRDGRRGRQLPRERLRHRGRPRGRLHEAARRHRHQPARRRHRDRCGHGQGGRRPRPGAAGARHRHHLDAAGRPRRPARRARWTSVQKAAAANVPVTVNIMDMNFKTGGNWGQAMVDAAQATLDQLRKVYPNASEAVQNRTLSITVMIGRNDVGVITQPDDAQKVIDFAKSRGVGRLGFWALARDNGSCAKKVKAQPNCSGIAQKDWQFTQQFAGYTGPTAA